LTSDAGPDAGAVPDADGGCPAGTVAAFVDTDQDGVGAGPAACLDPMAEGTSLTNTDCAPLDPAAFENRMVHPDGDGDEITTTPVMRCAGALPPTGTFFEQHPAGVLGLWGDVTNVAGPGVTWTNPQNATFANDSPAECRLTNDTTCDPLQDVSFQFVGPLPATLGGLRVAVRLRPEAGNLDVTVAVQLRANGMLLATVTRNNVTLVGTGSNGYTWVAFGGPGDLWGQATLPSPADITLRVLISTPAAVTRTIRADGISIMVFPPTGALDCNDADPLKWALLPGFTDGDGDYWGSGATSACLGPTVTSGFSWRDGDCADDDDRAHPGAAVQTTQITGSRGWDFDCDGTVEPAAVTNHAACVASADPDGGTGACLPTDAPLTPAVSQCGTSRANQTCDSTCMLAGGSQTVACR